MSIGMTFFMITGNFDFSIGSLMALANVVVIFSQSYFCIPIVIILSLFSGVTLGVINGFLVTKVKMNAFVTTLAAMIGIRGVVYFLTGEKSVIGVNLEFTNIGVRKNIWYSYPLYYIYCHICCGFFYIETYCSW